MVESTATQEAAPPREPPQARLDGWRYGRILLTLSSALALLALYAPWEHITAPGGRLNIDAPIVTIFTNAFRPGNLIVDVEAYGPLVTDMTHALINTVPPILGLLLAFLLWVRLSRWLQTGVLVASGLVLLGLCVVAVEYVRLILAIQSGSYLGLQDATHIGNLRIIRGITFTPGWPLGGNGLDTHPSSTFAWGFYLLVAAIVLWAAGLFLVAMALRRGQVPPVVDQSAAPDARSRRLDGVDRRVMAALLALGAVAWGLGTSYLPWFVFRCPPPGPNAGDTFCVMGSAPGNLAYVFLAHSFSNDPNSAASILSPSALSIGNDIVFGSLTPFAFIMLFGIGSALYVALRKPVRSGMWGYWAYLALVALITVVMFARIRMMNDQGAVGSLSPLYGVFVTLAGVALLAAAVFLLQRSSFAPREQILSD